MAARRLCCPYRPGHCSNLGIGEIYVAYHATYSLACLGSHAAAYSRAPPTRTPLAHGGSIRRSTTRSSTPQRRPRPTAWRSAPAAAASPALASALESGRPRPPCLALSALVAHAHSPLRGTHSVRGATSRGLRWSSCTVRNHDHLRDSESGEVNLRPHRSSPRAPTVTSSAVSCLPLT